MNENEPFNHITADNLADLLPDLVAGTKASVGAWVITPAPDSRRGNHPAAAVLSSPRWLAQPGGWGGERNLAETGPVVEAVKCRDSETRRLSPSERVGVESSG